METRHFVCVGLLLVVAIGVTAKVSNPKIYFRDDQTETELQQELEILEDELADADLNVKEAQEAQIAAERTRDSIYNSWKFTTSQLESALIDLNKAKATHALLQEEKRTMEMDLNKMTNELKQQARMHEMNMQTLKNDNELLRLELQEARRLLERSKRNHSLRSVNITTPFVMPTAVI